MEKYFAEIEESLSDNKIIFYDPKGKYFISLQKIKVKKKIIKASISLSR